MHAGAPVEISLAAFDGDPVRIVLSAMALASAGFVSGFMAGLFGIGGGVITVPVLAALLPLLGVSEGIAMQVAIGTSLGLIVPTAVRSFLAHRARGAADLDLLRTWLIPVPLGVAIASLMAARLTADALMVAFAAIALVVGLWMIVGPSDGRKLIAMPTGIGRALVGGGIGLVSTLMGIGGGVFNNTMMVLAGRPVHQAVATSAGLGALIAFPGVVGMIVAGWGREALPPFSLGFVNLAALAAMAPTSLMAAPLGARTAHRMPGRLLKAALGVFFLVVAARFLVVALGD